jgi:hypothetical protein
MWESLALKINFNLIGCVERILSNLILEKKVCLKKKSSYPFKRSYECQDHKYKTKNIHQKVRLRHKDKL